MKTKTIRTSKKFYNDTVTEKEYKDAVLELTDVFLQQVSLEELKNGFMTAIKKIPCSELKIHYMVDEYKRADGQYIYKGEMLAREEIEKQLKELQPHCIESIFKYDLECGQELSESVLKWWVNR
jgi:hypothetical protein